MSKYLDIDIYAKAKKEIFKEYQKPSAYRSMALIKKYKQLGGRINENIKKGGTGLWLEEKWKNLTPYVEGLVPSISKTPVCGKRHPDQKGPSICRPTIKKKGTTSLAQDFTKSQMKKAVDIKKKGGIIKWNFL